MPVTNKNRNVEGFLLKKGFESFNLISFVKTLGNDYFNVLNHICKFEKKQKRIPKLIWKI